MSSMLLERPSTTMKKRQPSETPEATVVEQAARVPRRLAGTCQVLDLVVIPWGYVLASYVRQPGDRWRPVG